MGSMLIYIAQTPTRKSKIHQVIFVDQKLQLPLIFILALPPKNRDYLTLRITLVCNRINKL